MADKTTVPFASAFSGFVAGPKHAETRLWAICEGVGCGAVTEFDTRRWPGTRLTQLPLSALETRLRCSCGARRARLQRWAQKSDNQNAIIYPFS